MNVELGQGLKLRQHSHDGSYRTYIYRVGIMLQDIVADIGRQQVNVNGKIFHWNVTQTLRLPGVWVMMEGSLLRFVLDSGVEIDVRNHVHPDDNLLGADFLNVEVENEDRLSLQTNGLLGKGHAFFPSFQTFRCK